MERTEHFASKVQRDHLSRSLVKGMLIGNDCLSGREHVLHVLVIGFNFQNMRFLLKDACVINTM